MQLRDVKQRFFALRNGLLADMLRKQCGLRQKVIFGLNLPQLREVADEAGTDAALADALWADTDVRESRLLAPMVAPVNDGARLNWLEQVLTVEEADVVCHRLLRHLPGAEERAAAALSSPEPLVRYAGLRLLLNLMPDSRAVLEREIAGIAFHPLTDGLVRRISSEFADVDSL